MGGTGRNELESNEGNEKDYNIRARLVAQESPKGRLESLFAATPPWESVKLLFSLAVTMGCGWTFDKTEGRKIEIIDVRRGYFYAKARRKVFVALVHINPPDADGWLTRLAPGLRYRDFRVNHVLVELGKLDTTYSFICVHQ